MSKSSLVDEQVCRFWAKIHTLAPQRFSDYSDPGDLDERDALARYVWNLELCSALYHSLHFLEICLRNTVHNAMLNHTGQATWFDNPSLIKSNGATSIEKVRREFKKRGKTATADDIVACLPFGFWTTLFSQEFEQRVFIPNAAAMFPDMPRILRTRSTISPLLEDARKLRNRVFHHEPIWRFGNLEARHDSVVRTVGYISEPAMVATLLVDDFLLVYRLGWEDTRNRLGDMLAKIESKRREKAPRPPSP